MTIRTYGFAHPLKYDEIKPGMLIKGLWGKRTVVGLAFATSRETALVVIDDNGEDEPTPPYVLDLNELNGSTVAIPGIREIEPADGDGSFVLLPQRRPPEGVIISSDGRIGVSVIHHNFGGKKHLVLDLASGEPMADIKHMAALPDWRLSVVEDGRTTKRLVSVDA